VAHRSAALLACEPSYPTATGAVSDDIVPPRS
jgi:hypothetical protein